MQHCAGGKKKTIKNKLVVAFVHGRGEEEENALT